MNLCLCNLMTFISFIFVNNIYCLRLVGEWKADEFYKFLIKFGFQKTNSLDKVATRGYIYGNITTHGNINNKFSLVVLDSEHFIDFFTNRTVVHRSLACNRMFAGINKLAWHRNCNLLGKQDLLRSIPCNKGDLCEEEDINSNFVIPKYQFTYHVQDIQQPRFWYISMVACSRNLTNSSCNWLHDTSLQNLIINYDIWFVNGPPEKKHLNYFSHHFSFEYHNIFELYLIFVILYTFALPTQIYAFYQKRHVLSALLLICISLEFGGILLNFSHILFYSQNGIGLPKINLLGNLVDLIAQSFLMLLLLLVVKGLGITCNRLPTFNLLIVLVTWLAYSMANIVLFIFNLGEVDFITDVSEWQTWSGMLIMVFRISIMFWFLMELRNIFLKERDIVKSKFYLHFGAGFLVWFIYLPIVVIICTHLSLFWRYKLILSVIYSADFLSLCVIIYHLWPTQCYLVYSLRNSPNYSMLLAEMDEFNTVYREDFDDEN